MRPEPTPGAARAMLLLACCAVATDLAWTGLTALRIAASGAASGEAPMILMAFIPRGLLALAAAGKLGREH